MTTRAASPIDQPPAKRTRHSTQGARKVTTTKTNPASENATLTTSENTTPSVAENETSDNTAMSESSIVAHSGSSVQDATHAAQPTTPPNRNNELPSTPSDWTRSTASDTSVPPTPSDLAQVSPGAKSFVANSPIATTALLGDDMTLLAAQLTGTPPTGEGAAAVAPKIDPPTVPPTTVATAAAAPTPAVNPTTQALPGPALLPAATIAAPPEAAVPAVLEGHEDVPAEIQARMLDVTTTNDSQQRVYGLSSFPTQTQWGRPGSEHEKKLLVQGQPFTTRIPGRVKTMWFFDRNGQPHSRVNIGLAPAHDTDVEALKRVYGLARPRARTAPQLIYASRLQGERQKGSFAETAVPFVDVFDARDGVISRDEGRRIEAVDFLPNDIVAIDAAVTRYKTNKGAGWTNFSVAFELEAIYLLWDSTA